MKNILLVLTFTLTLSNISFGQNPTSGGTIGVINIDTITDVTYFVGDIPDTLGSILPASGGNTSLPIEYKWQFITFDTPLTTTPAPGIINKEYYIPPTDSISTLFYYRFARRTGSGNPNFNVSTNIITVRILPQPVSTNTLHTSKINIYPNPVTKYLHIEFKENNSSNYVVDIFDIKGALQKTISFENINTVQIINLQNLSKGVYFIHLTDLENKKSESFKILKE